MLNGCPWLLVPFHLLQGVFESLLEGLNLHGRDDDDAAAAALRAPEERLETGIFMLAETAASCGPLERDCLVHLCSQAALHPPCLPLVGASLDWLAAKLGYRDRHAYMCWHQVPFLASWLSQRPLASLLPIRELVAPTEKGYGGEVEYVEAAAPALVGLLAFGQKSEDLELLALLLKKKASLIAPSWYLISPSISKRRKRKVLHV
jgi:hypothetical protein